jgi:multidrug efflux pump subunit AcrA (membrane-fusion protein)
VEGIPIIMLRRRWRRILIVVAVVIIAGGGYAYYLRAQQAQTAAEPELQTTTVRTGSIVISATGSGTLIAAKTADIGFGTSGQVSQILVEVGDHVEEGQLLATVDDTTAKLEVTEAELNLQMLTGAQAVADAQAALADAQAELKDATYKWQVNQPGHRATSETLELAQSQLDIAQAKFESAQSDYDHTSWRSADDPVRVAAASGLASARSAYYTALGNLNWYTGKPTEIEQAQLEAAVAQAQAKVDSAQAYLDELTGASSADDATASPSQDLIKLRQARLNLDNANEALDGTKLMAPMAGTVVSVDLTVGGNAGTDRVISLADLSTPTLQVNLDETDLQLIDVGNEADVIFDAYPDIILTGTVFGGVQTVSAVVELDLNQQDLPSRLPVGLSATVDVISARAENVLIVPVEALRELSAGEYSVFVEENGQLRLRTVEVGLMDLTSAEIKSGLQLGEVVSTGVVQTAQ